MAQNIPHRRDPAVKKFAEIAGDTVPALVLAKLTIARTEEQVVLTRQEAAALICMFEYLMNELNKKDSE